MPAGVAAALGAVLDDGLVLAGGLDEFASFEDVVAARLFHVHVFAGLDGPDRQQRVPVVGRGDGDHVPLFVLQCLADVLETLGGVAAATANGFDARGKQTRVGVDQMCHLHLVHAQIGADVAAAATVDAGHTHTDRIVRPQDATRCLGAGDGKRGGHSGGGRRLLEKGSACGSLHDRSPCKHFDAKGRLNRGLPAQARRHDCCASRACRPAQLRQVSSAHSNVFAIMPQDVTAAAASMPPDVVANRSAVAAHAGKRPLAGTKRPVLQTPLWNH